MVRPRLKTDSDQRPFVIVYHDFLETPLLTASEKLLFITLKKFADSKNHCFPSLKKLSDVTGMSKRKIQDTLKEMEIKKIISIESRQREDGGKSSNLYKLYDFKDLWEVEKKEDFEVKIDEYEEKKIIGLLESKGYKVTKEKELESTPTKEKNQALYKQSHIDDDTTKSLLSQETERYTIDQIRQIYDYDIMIFDEPLKKDNIDACINILHNVLNTSKQSIRISGEDKPSMVVISKLMKLTHHSILYAIRKYESITERIKNPSGYMLTLLYGAQEQMSLDITNQVQHDLNL